MKLTVAYNAENGFHIADGGAEDWIDIFITKFLENKKDLKITVASALLIDYFRLRLAQGIITPDQIQFKFDDEIIKANKYGTLERWPNGFCDKTMDILEELLTIGSDAAKARKKERMGGSDMPH